MIVMDIVNRGGNFGFFFFKQKTAYEMRISDWSSDVCSSDLILFVRPTGALNDAEEPRWIAAIEGLARADARILHSRAVFHDEYSFMPGHFTWGMVAIEPMDEAALLAALPGAAEIVEAVALGEPLDAGLRNPDLGGTKRTILVRTEDGLYGTAVAAFEKAMLATPRYLTANRHLRVTRVTSPRGGWNP